MEDLAKFIMVRYYLTSELNETDIDLSIKEVELYKKALKEVGSEEELKNQLDDYIKNNDWTGYLGTVGSGNRERHFAIEGTMDYCASSVGYDDTDLFNDVFDKSN